MPGRADPVAHTSPEVVAPGVRRIVAVIATGFFLLVVFGHGLVDLVAPLPKPTLIGQEKVAEEQRRAKARFLDGSLAKRFEDDLQQSSRIRRKSLAIYVPFLVRWFGEAGSRFVSGSDNFLFLRERLAVATIPHDALIGLGTGRLRALSRYLALLGTRTIVMPLPRKCVAMADKLPWGVTTHPEYDSDLVAGLRRAGVEVVDLLPVFASHAGPPVYLQFDSHWSTTGIDLAARAVASAVLRGGALRSPKERELDWQYPPTQAAQLLGLDPLAAELLPPLPTKITQLVDKNDAQVLLDPPATGTLPMALGGTSFSRGAPRGSTYFPEILSALIGQPLWNAAMPGEATLQALAGGLRQAGGRIPPTLVLEFPNHQLLCEPNPCWHVGAVFAELPSSERLTGLQHGLADRFGLPAFGGGKLTPGRLQVAGGDHAVAALQGSIVLPRDGTVLLRARGDVQTPFEMSIDFEQSRNFAIWQPGRREILLPYAGYALSTNPTVMARASQGEAKLTLETLELVCDLDLAKGVLGAPTTAAVERSADGGWHSSHAFADLATDDAYVGVAIPGEAGEEVSRQVVAHFTDGTSAALFGPGKLRPYAHLLLPLDRSGGALREIEVRGAGAAPSGPVRVWRLVR